MKKVISILLALLMITTLFACANKETEPSANVSSPSDTVSEASDASAADTGEASESSDVLEDITVDFDEDLIGFFSDGVDPQSRETYNIVHMYPYSIELYAKVNDCLFDYADKLNCTITPSTSEGDYDQFIQNIEVLASQGEVDGFIVVIDMATSERIKEVLDETGIPYVAWCNSVRDESGSNLVPCIGLDHAGAAEMALQWLYDNYKTYWGDIDTSKIALMSTTATSNVDLDSRSLAYEALFKELIPENAGIFRLDMVADFSMDVAYNQASATFSANPNIEYWFCTNSLETHAQGVGRAAESLHIDDKALVTVVGQNALVAEWDSGYDGCAVCCYASNDYTQAIPPLCAIIALIEGKATWDTLWTEERAEGDLYTFLPTPGEILTVDTYKAWHNKYAQAVGAELPYPDA